MGMTVPLLFCLVLAVEGLFAQVLSASVFESDLDWFSRSVFLGTVEVG